MDRKGNRHRPLQLLHGVPNGGSHFLRPGCGAKAGASPNEERVTQSFAKAAQCVTDRRRAETQPIPGARRVALIHERKEDPQKIEVEVRKLHSFHN
jgi:hypothetical protein